MDEGQWFMWWKTATLSSRPKVLCTSSLSCFLLLERSILHISEVITIRCGTVESTETGCQLLFVSFVRFRHLPRSNVVDAVLCCPRELKWDVTEVKIAFWSRCSDCGRWSIGVPLIIVIGHVHRHKTMWRIESHLDTFLSVVPIASLCASYRAFREGNCFSIRGL